MTDKELLELAAKASGESTVYRGFGNSWNPLTDDGDALRLAVKFGMAIKIRHHKDVTDVLIPHRYAVGCSHGLNGGSLAATRRAIVRAAAEIGKAMK